MFSFKKMANKGVVSLIKTALGVGISMPLVSWLLSQIGLTADMSIRDVVVYVLDHWLPMLSTMTLGGVITAIITMFQNWLKNKNGSLDAPINKDGVRG